MTPRRNEHGGFPAISRHNVCFLSGSGVDPELYELTTAKLDLGGSSSRVADAFARLMSTMEKTSTSTRSAGPAPSESCRLLPRFLTLCCHFLCGQEAQEGGEPERGGGESDGRPARPVLHAGQSADVSCHADAASFSERDGLRLRPHRPDAALAPPSSDFTKLISFISFALYFSTFVLFFFFKRSCLCFIYFKNKVKHLGRMRTTSHIKANL